MELLPGASSTVSPSTLIQYDSGHFSLAFLILKDILSSWMMPFRSSCPSLQLSPCKSWPPRSSSASTCLTSSSLSLAHPFSSFSARYISPLSCVFSSTPHLHSLLCVVDLLSPFDDANARLKEHCILSSSHSSFLNRPRYSLCLVLLTFPISFPPLAFLTPYRDLMP